MSTEIKGTHQSLIKLMVKWNHTSLMDDIVFNIVLLNTIVSYITSIYNIKFHHKQ